MLALSSVPAGTCDRIDEALFLSLGADVSNALSLILRGFSGQIPVPSKPATAFSRVPDLFQGVNTSE